MKHHRTTYITSLSLIASLFLVLLPTAQVVPPVAFASEQTPDEQVPNEQTQPQVGTVQISQEFATISAAAGADARALPSADADVENVLAAGDTLRVVGRSYDEDAQTEWVAVEMAADATAWVDASTVNLTAEAVDAPAATVGPKEGISSTDEEIVYLDNVGRIMVFDVEQAGEQRVTWQSPETGFLDIALGDFNNDGDDEIVGVRGSGAAGELIVYDPVLNSSSIPAANAGSTEIPWAELHRRTIGFTPFLVAAGELDQGIPGDEILYVYETSGSTSEVVVIKGDSLTPDGSGWLTHIPSDGRRGVTFPHLWETATIANLNNSGADEVVFTDSRFAPKSFLKIFIVDNGGLDAAVAAADNNSSKLSWRGTTTGDVYGDGIPRLVAFRKATGNSVGSATAFISRFTGSALEEEEAVDAEVLNPQPSYAFTADVNGDNDDEVFYLRNVTASAEGIRLIARNRNAAIDVDKTEQSLDADNRWKVGVGVDVDGNNVDEIAIMEENAIRIYRYEATGDDFLKFYRNDEFVPTNGATIRAGNLDAIGFRSGASVDYEINSLGNRVAAGSSGTFSIKLTTTSAQSVQYQLQPLARPTWVTGFGPQSGTIDSVSGRTIDVGINAEALSPGTYSFNAELTTSSGDIVNTPLIIPVEFEVTAALMEVGTTEMSFVYHGCTLPLSLPPMTKTLRIDGTLGVNFTATVADVPSVVAARQSLSGNLVAAQLDDSGQLNLQDGWGNAATVQTAGGNAADRALSAAELNLAELDTAAMRAATWLSITPENGTIEAEIDLTVDPSQLPTTTVTASAMLILIGDPTTGTAPDNVRFVPVRFLCASTDVLLPVLSIE